MWEKCGRVGQVTFDNKLRRMRFAHSEYVILIAFPRQKWLRELAQLLLYTYFASFV